MYLEKFELISENPSSFNTDITQGDRRAYLVRTWSWSVVSLSVPSSLCLFCLFKIYNFMCVRNIKLNKKYVIITITMDPIIALAKNFTRSGKKFQSKKKTRKCKTQK